MNTLFPNTSNKTTQARKELQKGRNPNREPQYSELINKHLDNGLKFEDYIVVGRSPFFFLNEIYQNKKNLMKK